MVIEDEGLIRWALAKEFSVLGYRVEIARNAADARLRISEHQFDVAVASIHLPDGSGLDLFESFRQHSPATRVIVISGDTNPNIKARAFSEGAWQFIDKPFEVFQIVNLLKSVFEDHPDRRILRRYCCRLPLRISIVEPTPEESNLDLNNLGSTCLDVGPGGLRLETAYILRPGQHVRVEALRDDQPCASFVSANAVAEVVWSEPTTVGCVAGLRRLDAINPGRIS